MENAWTKRIKELEAENTRLRMLRDAAESRAQGLEEENKYLRAGCQDDTRQCPIVGTNNTLVDKAKELEAENKRLVALNETFPPEIARLEDRVSAEYEAERTDDRARIQELEAEVGRLMLMNPCNHTGFESALCDVCGYPDPRKLIAKLKEENQRLRRDFNAKHDCP